MSHPSIASIITKIAAFLLFFGMYVLGPVMSLSLINPAHAYSEETNSFVTTQGRNHHEGEDEHENEHHDDDEDEDDHGHHNDDEDHDKINICHSTSSNHNPWNAIQIDDSAWNSHKSHGDFKYYGPTKHNGKPDNKNNTADEWCENHEPVEPTPTPTSTPSCTPTLTPTVTPTEEPTGTPTTTPTEEPTGTPTTTPTEEPTGTPTTTPTEEPTGTPTTTPTEEPTGTPTTTPTEEPTGTPTTTPTEEPTGTPTTTPTEEPTGTPTMTPTTSPTEEPTGTSTPTSTPSTTGGTGGGEEVDDPTDNNEGNNNLPPVTTPTVIAQATGTPTPIATGTVLGERTCTNAVKLIGIQYLDVNKNGNYDFGEQLFSNITGKVTYTLGEREIFVDHFISDNEGRWEMTLCPGEYNITVNTGSIPRGVVDSADVHKVNVAADKAETTAFIAFLATASWNWSWWWLLLAVFILAVIYYLYRRRREYLETHPAN